MLSLQQSSRTKAKRSVLNVLYGSRQGSLSSVSQPCLIVLLYYSMTSAMTSCQPGRAELQSVTQTMQASTVVVAYFKIAVHCTCVKQAVDPFIPC